MALRRRRNVPVPAPPPFAPHLAVTSDSAERNVWLAGFRPPARGVGKEKGETNMDLAIQGAIWLGAGVTLVLLLSRRRKRRATR